MGSMSIWHWWLVHLRICNCLVVASLEALAALSNLTMSLVDSLAPGSPKGSSHCPQRGPIDISEFHELIDRRADAWVDVRDKFESLEHRSSLGLTPGHAALIQSIGEALRRFRAVDNAFQHGLIQSHMSCIQAWNDWNDSVTESVEVSQVRTPSPVDDSAGNRSHGSESPTPAKKLRSA